MDKRSGINREVKAIILDSGCDFGRCPLASRLPAALWPVMDKPAIEHLLDCLSEAAIKHTVICSNEEDAAVVRDAIDTKRYSMDLTFSTSTLPVGTAGSLRDAVGEDRESLLLVFPASLVNIPDITTLLELHRQGGCELTVLLNPSCAEYGINGESTGIYVCESAILEYIPEGGYYDIKESLIPEILRHGKDIYTAQLTAPAGNFRNHTEYTSAVSCYLQHCRQDFSVPLFEKDKLKTFWKPANASVDASARIYGPVVVMEKARILKDAVILGPAIIGCNSVVGESSLIVNSVLWDDSQVEPNCHIQGCVVDCGTVIPQDSILENQAVVSQSERRGYLKRPNGQLHELPAAADAANGETHAKMQFGQSRHTLQVIAGILFAAFIWSNWFTLKDLWTIWSRSDEYSSGLLVPFLTGFILWIRRDKLACCIVRPSLWGLMLFLASQAIKFFGLFFMYNSLERLSIIGGIAGLVLFLFGWRFFWKMFSILLFLCLMLPLPASVHNSLLMPLQSWATSSAVFCLEMLGYDVVRMGNIIDINGTTVAVVEACNGLRMITAFFVIGGFITLLSTRPKWEKILVFISGVPVALVCNTIRLTTTAIAFTYVKGEQWEKVFHDFGGYAMMPLAVVIIVFEFWLLDRIVSVRTVNQRVPVH